MLLFGEKGKPQYLGKNQSEQSGELTNSSTNDSGSRNQTQFILVEGISALTTVTTLLLKCCELSRGLPLVNCVFNITIMQANM